MSVQLNPSPGIDRESSPVKGERPGSSLPRPAGRVESGHYRLRFLFAGVALVGGLTSCEAEQPVVRPILSTTERGGLIAVTDGFRWDKLMGVDGDFVVTDPATAESICVNLYGGSFETRVEPTGDEWWCNDVDYTP